MNMSPYAFGELPDNRSLPVRSHAKISGAVKSAKKTKEHIDIASAAGLLRLTPITPEIIRVSYVKGVTTKIKNTYWKPKAEETVLWSAKESKSALRVATEKVVVIIDKKTGAMRFETADGTLLLKERTTEPRLIMGNQTWEFFDWEFSEKSMQKECFPQIFWCCAQGEVYFLWRKTDADATCFIGERIRNRCRCDTIRSSL